jgi:uncharacterized protein
MTEATYGALFARARPLLERGESVILDASFSRAPWRTTAATLATETCSELTELRCLVPADVAAARLHQRTVTGADASDAGAGIAAAMVHDFDSWPTATSVGTLPPAEDVLPAVLDRLGDPRPRRTTPTTPRDHRL